MWFVQAALASDAPAAEEIVVWGDRFQRWERRWYVQTELHLPETLTMLGWENRELELTAVQVRAVLSCDKDFPQGPNQWEVHCDIEDIGLVVMPRLASDADEQTVRELDATLTEAVVQLQVSADGGVPDIDLEGVAAVDERSRLRAERLRQLMARVMLPFHLDIPEPIHDGKQWPDYHDRLMSMPSDTGSTGGTATVHVLSALNPDWFVIQTIGRSTVSALGGVEGVSRERNLTNGLWDVVTYPVDRFELDQHGVAMVEQATGIMTERVWVVSGTRTSSSPHALDQTAYYHAGRLQMLGETDHPDVGPTVVASRPDGRDPSRPAWVPLPE
ncbi:MAG: hypothetical protein ABMB14_36445 [Myxococcota bacterium]